MNEATPVDGGRRIALVLSGGGARAAYQVGLLRCLGHHLPDYRFDIVTGTSAGAINAVYLASHRDGIAEAANGLSALWGDLTFDQVFRTGSLSLGNKVLGWGARLLSGGAKVVPEGPRGLLDTSPLRSLLRRALETVDGEIAEIADNLDEGRLEALALTTLDYATGRTVTWTQGRDIGTWERPHRRSAAARIGIDHVMASAALPLLFPAVRLGDSWFGDGGVRLSAPLAPAIHLGAERIVAISTRYPRSKKEAEERVIAGYPPPAQVLGTVLNALFLDVIEQDSLHLERINRLLRHAPEEAWGTLRPVDLLVLAPSEDLGRLAAEYETGLPPVFRFLTRGLGTRETLSPDLLSLLMFHPEYLRRLMEIGEADAEGQIDRLVELLGAGTTG